MSVAGPSTRESTSILGNDVSQKKKKKFAATAAHGVANPLLARLVNSVTGCCPIEPRVEGCG